jgi:hypothetical protein
MKQWHYLETLLAGYLEEIQSIVEELEKLHYQRAERSETDDDDTKRLRRLAIAELNRRKTAAEAVLGHAIWNAYSQDKGNAALDAAEGRL